jgi:hypothetical protein
MAWRNLWRHWRRTWLTVGAMIFSNGLLIFAMSLQFGSYDMMIDNSLQAYSGHLQLQHPRYLDDPLLRAADHRCRSGARATGIDPARPGQTGTISRTRRSR